MLCRDRRTARALEQPQLAPQTTLHQTTTVPRPCLRTCTLTVFDNHHHLKAIYIHLSRQTTNTKKCTTLDRPPLPGLVDLLSSSSSSSSSSPTMDTGTYNCRDYHITSHFSATTLTSPLSNTTNTTLTTIHNNVANTHLPPRHESWADLEHRSRSPASFAPKFPLLALPLELRQQILSYLLPRTQELGTHVDALESHVRNFSSVQKRVRKGMELPPERAAEKHAAAAGRGKGGRGKSSVPTNIAWRRGSTSLLSVNQQLHNECADLIYGRNTFMLGVTFSSITFRFRFLLPSGMAPKREYNFLELMPERYLRRLRRVLVCVDHVDSYTGMIKYNVSGRGLVGGLRGQVGRLVGALGPVVAAGREHDPEGEIGGGGEAQERESAAERPELLSPPPGLSKLLIRISSGNAVTASLKSQFGESQRISKDIEEILEPFGHLCGVRDARVMGAVGHDYARALEERMRGFEHGKQQGCCCSGGMADLAVDEKAVQLCVYGNDIS